jgi:hypothetical protein
MVLSRRANTSPMLNCILRCCCSSNGSRVFCYVLQ